MIDNTHGNNSVPFYMHVFTSQILNDRKWRSLQFLSVFLICFPRQKKSIPETDYLYSLSDSLFAAKYKANTFF